MNEAWTEEELEKAVSIEPMSGSDMVKEGLTGGWEDLGITDSVEWIQEQRLKRRERQNSPHTSPDRGDGM